MREGVGYSAANRRFLWDYGPTFWNDLPIKKLVSNDDDDDNDTGSMSSSPRMPPTNRTPFFTCCKHQPSYHNDKYWTNCI